MEQNEENNVSDNGSKMIGRNESTENTQMQEVEESRASYVTQKNILDSQMMIIAIAILLSSVVVAGVVVYSENNINAELKNINSRLTGVEGQVKTLAGSGQGQVAQPSAQPIVQPAAQAQAKPVNINLAGKIPRGDPNAKITIVEYSDFQCPFCSRAKATMDQILKDYQGKVKLYYKQFPLTSIHQYAQKAAEASECAEDQGKFWEYHDKLFDNQGSLDTASLKKYAADLGLDTAKFNACLDNGDKSSQVNSEQQEGISNGVQGTPAFFINGQFISGAQPYSTFKSVIDPLLAS
jgi:protein-disulfide isomerase